MLVYCYGAKIPKSNKSNKNNLKLALDILYKAGQYYNSLIELERYRRIALQCGADSKEVKEAYNADIRQARSNSGLSSGTYWLVEDAVKKSSKSTPFLDLPKFRNNRKNPWQLIGANIGSNNDRKPKVEDLNSNSGIVRIDMSAKYPLVKLRVGDAKKKEDAFFEISVKMHRPLPKNANIQKAIVKRERVGDRWIWKLLFTVNIDKERLIKGKGKIAINLGWRSLGKKGVRVAYAVGNDGRKFELILPKALLNKAKHSDDLQQMSDRIAVERFGKNGAKIRHKERYIALKQYPLQGSFLSKEPLNINSTYEHWARKDLHYYQWTCDERRKFINARNYIYKIWANMLSKEYEEVLIEDWSLAYFALKTTKSEIPAARHYRFLVAPSSLKTEIKHMFGNNVVETKGKYTITCPVCKNESLLIKKNKSKNIIVQCERCCSKFDQDEGNALNQLDDVI